jgi:hypothetical protein
MIGGVVSVNALVLALACVRPGRGWHGGVSWYVVASVAEVTSDVVAREQPSSDVGPGQLTEAC